LKSLGLKKQLLTVKVQPKAKKVGVEKISDYSYKVRVHAAPEKGAANKEVIVSLAAYFDVPPSRVRIVRGKTSRTKQIEIEGS
jgi:uncharacterized protein (TIGR00251 family)